MPAYEEALQVGDVERAAEIHGCAPSLKEPENRTADRIVLALMITGGGFEAVRLGARVHGVETDDAMAEVWFRVSLAERVFTDERNRQR